MTKWVMVLNDGTTYSDLDGAGIKPVPDWVQDHELDEYVAQADAYYVFDRFPPLEGNNKLPMSEVEFANHARTYTKCGGCGMMFNLDSGFERIMAAQHNCDDSNNEETE